MGKSVSDENLLAFGQQFKQQLDPVIADSRGHVYYGQVDSTSTATVFTATIPGISKYEEGLTIVLKNGVITSASGFTLNINGLGALPAYTNLANETRETTIFNINYTLMFIYEKRVSGGDWLVYRGYDANTNTIGYQLRTNNTVRNVSDTARYYKIYFTSANGQMWVPASADSTNNASSARPVNQRPIDPFGPIVYTSAKSNYAAGSDLAASYIWQQYNLTLGYSFNRTGAVLTLTTERPVYVKCAPQTDGSAIMDASEPIVQALPTSKDGKIYIYLGLATGATTCELQVWHPVYWHDGTGIRLWTGAEPSSGGITGTGVTAIVALTQRTLYASGSTIAMDVFNELAIGTNRVRFTFEAEDGSVTSSIVYTIRLAELYVELFQNTWYTPILQSNSDSWYLGGFKIAGAGYKVLHLDVFDVENTQVATITQDIGTTNAYISTPYFYRFTNASPLLSLPTGTYKVRAYVTTDTLSSEVIEYYVMYVRSLDAETAKLVVANEVAEQVYNYSTSTITKYAAYNCGLSTCDLDIQFSRMNGSSVVDTDTYSLTGVPTVAEQTLDYLAEWEVVGDGYNIAFLITLDESSAGATVPLDNSLIFPPTSGYDFYLNAALRSNSDPNRTKIENAADDSEITPIWTNIDFLDGVDGWTTDDTGHRCLLIPAGCSLSIPYSAFQFIDGDDITLEMAYKVANVAQPDETVLTIATNPTQPGFQGLRIKTNGITLHSATDTSAEYDSARGTNLGDGELIHLCITINPNFEGNNKLVKGFINGNKNFEFAYSASTDWPTNANLIIAPQKSDVYIYSIRHYPMAIADPMVQNNYINSLYTVDERVAMDAFLKSVVDAGQTNVDYETVKNNDYNYFVITMDGGATIPSRANGWGKDAKGLSTLEMHYGKHPEWDWRIGPLETGGQGTTSMDYYRWNMRWRIDKTDDSKKVPVQYVTNRTRVGQSYQYAWSPAVSSKTVFFDGEGNHPAVKRITAKINQASSMQSHKMGATKAYSDLLYGLGLYNEAQEAAISGNTPVPTTAVYQYPAFGFEYNPTYGTYTFCGLFTIGPDKGDKPTFGYDLVGETLISMEGTDHSEPLAKFAYPWNSDVMFLASEEGISIVKGSGSYSTGLEVGNCHDLSTDKAADQDAVRAVLNTEFKPAYDLVWNNSTLIFGIALGTYAATAAATLTYINSHLESFRGTAYDDRFTYADMQFWIDGEYKLYYYDIKLERYVVGQTLGSPTGSTIEEKNEYFKAQRRAAFKASAENYWDIQDALFHFDYLVIFGATDNYAKNSYPYKMQTLAQGGRWKWRQDDLDSIFDIDNTGADTKPYYIEYEDAVNNSPYFAGSASIFWNLIFECYWEDYTSTATGTVMGGLQSMGKDILDKMRDLSGAASTYAGFINYIKQTFWDKAQLYFPQSAYNVDANFKYEQAWLNNGQAVDPLSQALGNHYSGEALWVHRRAVYTLSLFHAGPFGDYSDTTLGTISFRPQGISTTLVPAMWLYPAIGVGQGMLNGTRREPGDGQPFSTSGDGNTTFYIQGSNYLSSLGDLKNLVLGAQYVNPMTITGAMLTTFKIGDASASVTTNVPGLTFSNTACLEIIDARNASSVRAIDIASCTRLRELYLAGTSVPSVNIPNGSKITDVSLPNTIQSISFLNLRHLDDENITFEGLSNVRSIRVEHTKADALTILQSVYNASQSLTNLRLIWDRMYIDSDGSILSFLTALAQGDYKGLDADGNEIDTPILEGSVNIQQSIYQQDADVVTNAFPTITLIYPAAYIRFEDATVESICASTWGDGIGLTAAQASVPTTLGTTFRGRTDIITFDELEYFTGLLTINGGGNTSGAFQNCTNLTHVTVPPSAYSIGQYVFSNCTSLTSFTIPTTLTDIGASAFSSCPTVFEGLENVVYLADWALNNSLYNDEAYFRNLGSAGVCALYNCHCRKLRFGPRFTNISPTSSNNRGLCSTNMAAADTILEEVQFDGTVTSIGPWAFANQAKLTTINLTSALTYIGSGAFRWSGIGGVLNFPNLTYIGDRSFGGTKITRVVNLGSAKQLLDYTFESCSLLTEITCPPSLSFISANVIIAAPVLEKITFTSLVPPGLSTSGFISGTCPLFTRMYVPEGTLRDYMTTTNLNVWYPYFTENDAEDYNTEVIDDVMLQGGGWPAMIEEEGYCVTLPIPIVGTHTLTIANYVTSTDGKYAISFLNTNRQRINGAYWNSTEVRTGSQNDANRGYICVTCLKSRLSDCYVHDDTTNIMLWSGSNITKFYTSEGHGIVLPYGEVDLTQYEQLNASLGSDRWYLPSERQAHLAIPVNPGEKFEIELTGYTTWAGAATTGSSFYNFVNRSDYGRDHYHGETVASTTGSVRLTMAFGDAAVIMTAPTNSAYLVLTTVDGANNRATWRVEKLHED